MKHDYYYYTKEELLKSPKIPLIIMPDNKGVFLSIAEEMVKEIEQKNKLGERTVFICPVGPVGQYPYFVEMINEKEISLENVWFINMDEYLDEKKQWIPKEHPLSFKGFMEREVYLKLKSKLVMPKTQQIFPDPNQLDFIPELIEKLGGVDIAFGGIGINGHIAFNEPQDELANKDFLNLSTRVLDISKETRTANAIGDLNGALDDMPYHCITIGMKEIKGARKIRLGCFRNWHRGVVRHAAYGEPSSHFPVTLLQDHPDISIKLTQFVANLE